MFSRINLNIIFKKLPSAALTLFGSAYGYMIYRVFQESIRAHDITGEPFGPEYNDLVKNPSDFPLSGGKPSHGTLPSEFLINPTTGKIFVKKSAHSRKNLVKEFMYGSLFNCITHHQPEAFIFQKDNTKCKTQFATLSEVPNSSTQDLEDFVRANRIHEMHEKKLEGLELSLVIDQMTGKTDTKLDNFIVKEFTDDNGVKTLIVSTIDHERADPPRRSFLDSGNIRTTVDTNTLVNSIHDLYPRDSENHAGLAGDPQATEWGTIAKQKMNPAKVIEAYKSIAQVDTAPVIAKCLRLASSGNGLFRKAECDDYKNHFDKLKAAAADTVERLTNNIIAKKP
jgi:hypothetical protein